MLVWVRRQPDVCGGWLWSRTFDVELVWQPRACGGGDNSNVYGFGDLEKNESDTSRERKLQTHLPRLNENADAVAKQNHPACLLIVARATSSFTNP